MNSLNMFLTVMHRILIIIFLSLSLMIILHDMKK